MSKHVIQEPCEGKHIYREVYNVDMSPTNDFCVSFISEIFHCILVCDDDGGGGGMSKESEPE